MRIPVLLLGLIFFKSANTQTIFFSENAGTPVTTTVISAYTGWQNVSPASFSSTSIPESDVRNTVNSSGYTGASGGGNIFFTNVAGRDFIISGINTLGYSGLALSFGHYKNTVSGNNELLVEVSGDGLSYSALSYDRPTGTGTANWILITAVGAIPASSNLHIRFTQMSATTQLRIDDIALRGSTVLPVHFAGFRAYGRGEAIKLDWKNLTESEVIIYSIERSGNGIDFSSIGSCVANRNDGGEASYTWLDPDPYAGINFYRIRSLETNGTMRYSVIVRVDRKGGAISIYPNPLTTSTLTLQTELPGGSYPLQINNAAGQVVYHRIMHHNGGNQTETIDLPGLRSGIYYLMVAGRVISFIKD